MASASWRAVFGPSASWASVLSHRRGRGRTFPVARTSNPTPSVQRVSSLPSNCMCLRW